MSTPIRPGNLSQREIEVIQLIADGLTDKEIAERLFITQRTVAEHIVNIRSKLGASNRASAVYAYFVKSMRRRDGAVADSRSRIMSDHVMRAAQPADAPAIAALRFAINKIAEGHEQLNPLMLERVLDDVTREIVDTGFRFHVTEDKQGVLTGYSRLTHFPWEDSDVRDLELIVRPEARRHGIGDALWREALAEAVRQDARVLKSAVLDNTQAYLAWARMRGFKELFQRVNFTLDLTTFERERFADVSERVEARGIRISNMHEQGNTEEAQRKLYQLNAWCGTLDLPGIVDTPDWDSWENFRKTVCESSWYQPEGQTIAIDTQTGEWIGMCAVTSIDKTHSGDFLHTGVDRRYRRFPVIGQALKLAGIEYLLRNGARVAPDNHDTRDSFNIALNHEMGFRRLPGWIMLERRAGKST